MLFVTKNAIRDKTPPNEHRYQLGVNYLALKGEASESIRRIYFAGYRKARPEPHCYSI